jgi:hypothetical protein
MLLDFGNLKPPLFYREDNLSIKGMINEKSELIVSFYQQAFEHLSECAKSPEETAEYIRMLLHSSARSNTREALL